MLNVSYKPNIFVELMGLITFIIAVITGNLFCVGILFIIAIISQFL